MSSQPMFVQECPTCGRRVRVNVAYLGKAIQCRNCRAVFVASDPEQDSACEDSSSALLRRVDELLGIEQDERMPTVH